MAQEITHKTEVLAPAGSPESLVAAVRCGADGVYLGTQGFNARQNAQNFTFEQLKDAIGYSHACGVRVHIALNTLVRDDELDEVKKTIEHVCRLGADVLILQDIGLAALAQKCAANIERHASTQMTLQTPSGANLAKNQWGISTVVLPREMTKEELTSFRKNTDLRLEVFVHGAHCMCVSGQCYMSAMLGGRSANRGLCAQPCRLPFSSGKGDITGHSLSLKDLSLIDKAKELEEIGVDSMKIEGRMKRPEYVAAAVTAVRSALDGKDDEEINKALSAVFSRSGFSAGYYENKRTKDMFGIRTKSDVTAATQKVLSSLQALYAKENPRVAAEMNLTVKKGEKIRLCVSANGKTVRLYSAFAAQPAKQKPSDEQTLKRQLLKCGGTVFFPEKVDITLDEGVFVPLSEVNSLRRLALNELYKELSSVKPKPFTDVPIIIPSHKTDRQIKLSVRLSDVNQISDLFADVENLYFPLNFKENSVESVQKLNNNAGVELSRGLMGMAETVENRLLKMKNLGIKVALCGTLDAVAIAKKCGFEVHTSFSMNVLNSLSLHELELLGVKAVTLSPELSLNQAAKIGFDVKRGILAYGRLPLMLTRSCPMHNAVDCGACGGKGYLTDRKNVKFPVTCRDGFSEVINSRPIYMADKLSEMKNLDFALLHFTTESKAQAEDVFASFLEGRPATGIFTRGRY